MRSAIFSAAVLSVGIAACGLEDYPFLDRVTSGAITVSFTQKAAIRLPSVDSTYFTHFTIYYRIYVSGAYYSEVHTGNMNELNSVLASDYNYFLPYTNTDSTTSTSAMGTLFANRKYYPITLEGANIDAILGSNAFDKTITLDFTETTPRIIPNLSIDNQKYNLQRSTGNGVFRPAPENRYFINTPELNNKDNISNTSINADVIDKSDVVSTRYTYAALYIIVTGIDSYFSPLYSQPTFIGVFYLPLP
ncbi:MAG: hypothetical protein LBG73_04305 [Spirochaetaceae bacterium]|jgi:hypothetical protein|nr:hypothetical protein [Spirochaetaceae bacterium]